MKLRLPSLLRCALLSVLMVGAADAAVRHSDASLYTYVDFANNAGRYVTGVTNAMLDHIRQRDGGVCLSVRIARRGEYHQSVEDSDNEF